MTTYRCSSHVTSHSVNIACIRHHTPSTTVNKSKPKLGTSKNKAIIDSRLCPQNKTHNEYLLVVIDEQNETKPNQKHGSFTTACNIFMYQCFLVITHTHTHTHTRTHTLTSMHTHIRPFYDTLDFVRDNPGEPVLEETFTRYTHRSHQSSLSAFSIYYDTWHPLY